MALLKAQPGAGGTTTKGITWYQGAGYQSSERVMRVSVV